MSLSVIKRILLSLFAALLLILSFPKFDFQLLAWIALVPLFLAIKDRTLKIVFGLSFFTGICFFEGVFYWINGVKGFALLENLALGIYLGLYFGIFGLLLHLISKKTKFSLIITAPVLWVSLEYLRSNAGFLALPMALIGHSQYLNIPLIQIASMTGAYGVSFLVVMVNAVLSEIVWSVVSKRSVSNELHRCKAERHPNISPPLTGGDEGEGENKFKNHPHPNPPPSMGREFLENLRAGARTILLIKSSIVLILLASTLVYGYIVISQQPRGEKISVTVIQGNISQDIKWNPLFRKQNLDKHIKLTKEAVNNREPSLIVWPETSVTVPVKQDLYALLALTSLMKEINSSLLFGSSQSPKFGSAEFRRANNFNSAFLISYDKGFAGQYNKIHLFPFGEYLPFEGNIPWPARLSSFLSETGTIIPGKEYTIFHLEGPRFGTVICWESIFPSLFRQFVKKGAHFMINMTNEAWFGQTAAPYQFLASTIFRAVENRVSIARSANTGISCFISPYGEIIGKVKNKNKDIFVEGYLTMAIPLSHQKTFYTLYGDIFAYMNIFLTMLLIALSLLKIRRG